MAAVIRLSRRVVPAAFITRKTFCNGTMEGWGKEKKGVLREFWTCRHLALINSPDPICGSERLSPSSRVPQQGQLVRRGIKGGIRARIQAPLDRGGSNEDKTQKV